MSRWVFPVLAVLIVVAVVGGWFLLRPPVLVPPPNGNPPVQPGGDPTPAQKPQPPLVVLVVFDQMRGDYLARWADHFGPDGFERIKKEGVWFSNCQIPYACTSTGPGHAALATGAPPSVHGIIENEWYDRGSRSLMYCCQPNRPYELIPPVPAELGKPGRGSAQGFSPQRLLAETVGDSLVAATGGKGRVFSLSIKDRTAVLMGGQKPTGVYCFDTRDGKFHTGAFYDRDQVHPWVAEFNASKLVDSWFETPWERLRDKLDYTRFSSPDDASGEGDGFNGQGVTFPHRLNGTLKAPAKPYYDALECSPFGNELLFALVKRAIVAEKLGQSERPDLLCVSFSSNDLIGHIWGPDSQEVFDMTLRTDKLIAEMLGFLDTTLGKSGYVLVIAADHGVCPLPEQKEYQQKPYPLARRVSVTEIYDGLEGALNGVYGVSPGSRTEWFEAREDADRVWPWIYLNQRAIKERNLKFDDVCGVTRDWLVGRTSIKTAYTRKELEDGQSPADDPFNFKKMAFLAYRADRCGDVIAIPQPGVLVGSPKYKNGTTHGSPQAYDTHIPFLVYGHRVPALGQRPEVVSSLSIAPTLAWALNVPAPKQAIGPPPGAIGMPHQ